MAHQPGYLEAKACRILANARHYVFTPDNIMSLEHYERELGGTMRGYTTRHAWAILNTAYLAAVQARQAAIQHIRGY
jgi:hypothetical protein